MMKLFGKKTIQGIPIDKIKNEPIDMQGLFSSIANRDEIVDMYRKLSRISHPDRFVGSPEKQDRATQLFKSVQENQNSLRKLKEIEIMINKELL